MTPDHSTLHAVIFQAVRIALGMTEEKANRTIIRAFQDEPNAEPARHETVCYFDLRTDEGAPILQEESLIDLSSFADSSDAANTDNTAGTNNPDNTENSDNSANAANSSPSSAASDSDSSAIPLVSSFIPCRLLLTFYGSRCENLAHQSRAFLFLDGAGKPRQILRAAGMYLVPNPRPPVILYEESGKKHRKRADLILEARLLNHALHETFSTVEPIQTNLVIAPPAVQIHIPASTQT